MTSHSYSTPMHRHTAWAPYSYKRETSTHKNPQNLASTQSPTTQRRSLQQKETTTSMNESCWRSSKPYNTGDHTSSGHHNPSHSSLTTLILHSGSTLKK